MLVRADRSRQVVILYVTVLVSVRAAGGNECRCGESAVFHTTGSAIHT